MLPVIPSEVMAGGLEMAFYFFAAVAAFLGVLLMPRG
jgi:hypothetical protein